MKYRITLPSGRPVPVVLSIPHCGTAFPDELIDQYNPDRVSFPDDTDWHLERLYDFAAARGITTISAVFNRWVIDLNRSPDRKPLYSDGRIITDLCPVTTFLGEPLYRDHRRVVDASEVLRRRREYFDPYHARLSSLLETMVDNFGKVLLWDCHSIRQFVPTIRAERFPDLILGSADRVSAHPALIESALSSLGESGLTVQHNDPFKGGYITRHYANPSAGVHALQLEMVKTNYMDESETEFHVSRAAKMAEHLDKTLSRLLEVLNSL